MIGVMIWYLSKKKDLLFHHGIKNQQWGVRNGPPYPLNEKGKRNFRYHAAIKQARTAKQIVDDCSDYKVGSLTTMIHDGKEFVSGLSHGHDFDWMEGYLANDGKYHPASTFHKQYENSWNRDNGNDANGFIKSDLLRTFNPGYGLGSDAAGVTQNCAKCSAVLELAYKGYDHFKAGRQTYPSSSDAMEWWFDGAKPVDYDSPWSADKYLASYGPGASGTCSMRYKNGSGHAMHWHVGNDGSLRIEDGQNGKYFNSLKEANDEYGFDGGSVHTYRLDDCEPNWDHIGQDSVVRLTSRSHPEEAKVFNKWSGKVVDTW